jgi:hypothetical protein
VILHDVWMFGCGVVFGVALAVLVAELRDVAALTAEALAAEYGSAPD